MAEPIATPEPEETKAGAAEPAERFEHLAATPEAMHAVEAVEEETAEAVPETHSEPEPQKIPELAVEAVAEAAPVEPQPGEAERVEPDAPAAAATQTIAAAGLAALSEHDAATAAAPEWPMAWLKLVEPEEPKVEEAPMTASAEEPPEPPKASEPEEDKRPVSALSKSMASALDKPETKAAANDGEPFDPVSLWAKPKKEPEPEPEPEAETEAAPGPQAEAEAARNVAEGVAEDEEGALKRPAAKARNSAARKAKAEKAAMEARAGQIGRAAAVYLLYLAGFLVVPAIGGLLLAIEGRRNAPEWLESHYTFQIRTFWIGLAGTAIGLALLMSGYLTLVGLVLGLLLVVWLIVRSALGFINLVKLRPYPYPRAWLI